MSDRLQHPLDRQDAGVVLHDGLPPLQTHLDIRNPVQPLQGPLDAEGSAGAHHARDGEFRAAVGGRSFQQLRPDQASPGSDAQVPQLHLHRLLPGDCRPIPVSL